MTLDGVTYVSAVGLALVFVAAAVSKWRDHQLTAMSFASLGLRRPEALARMVPVAELVVAALLIVVPPVGGLASLVALGSFTIVLVRVLRSDEFASCACFGATSQRGVSKLDVHRNVGLGLVAVLAVLASRPVVPTLGDVVVVVVVGSFAMIALANAISRGTTD